MNPIINSDLAVKIHNTLFPIKRMSHGEFAPALNPDQVKAAVAAAKDTPCT